MHDTARHPIASAPRDGTQILLWCAGTHCDAPGFKLGRFIRLEKMVHLLVNGVPYGDYACRFPYWWALPDPDLGDQAEPDTEMASGDLFEGLRS